MELTRTERLMLCNQYRILEALYPEEAACFAHDRGAVENGYEYHYDELFLQISEHILGEAESVELLDTLEMFSRLKQAFENLEDKSGIEERLIRYDGFDGNSETRELHYVGYFCDRVDEQRFADLGHPVARNSHTPSVQRHRRMLAEWNRSANKLRLTKADIQRIGLASVHPDSR